MARIVIIEDEPDLRRVLEFNLREAGYDVASAATGRDGLELARQPPAALLVLDLMLPDVSGLEVCRALRGDPGTRSVAILMLTARGDENVSHELRTPVAAIRAAAETVRRSLETQPEAAGEFLAMIDRHAGRLDRLVQDLLELARIESTGYRPALEPLALAPIAGEVAASFRAAAERKGIALAVDVAVTLPLVRADRRAVEQVLTNLLDNAVKYCSEGTRVVLRAATTDAGMRVELEDSGPGIAAEHQPRIFERFYRADPGRSRELGGTGLGLSIVKHLVEAMGGSVRVESVAGRGSTFGFTLPVA